MQKMKIVIDKNGKTVIHVEGVAGASCKDFTRVIENAIGVVQQCDLTDDYYKTDEQIHLGTKVEL